MNELGNPREDLQADAGGGAITKGTAGPNDDERRGSHPQPYGPRGDRVVVVGAGVGGLASAITLARAGVSVVVVDKSTQPGGKLRALQVGGRGIDSGPTVLTMRWVFEELFGSSQALAERVPMIRAKRLARHAWADGSVLDLFADAEETADAIGVFAGAQEARGYLAFSRHSKEIYATIEEPFLRSQKPTAAVLAREAGKLGFRALTKIDAHRTMWKAISSCFQDERLRQLFGRYATYVGSSPFRTPATLNVVAHVEREGVWLVDGGMTRLLDALVQRAVDLGVQFRLGSTVERLTLRGGAVSGALLDGGEWLEADAVVFNADVGALGAGLFGTEVGRVTTPVEPHDRSLSALTWSIVGTARSRVPLVRHTVFFSRSYHEEMDDLFVRRQLPREGTVYVCAQDRDDAGHPGTDEAERLLLILNSPADGDRQEDNEKEIDACEERAFRWLKNYGLELTLSAVQRTSSRDFERLFPGTGGALYGRASHGPLASLVRPGARTKIPNLYLAGGSVHPGPGVPMAALSGQLASKLALSDLGSTQRRARVATVGST